MKGMIMKPYKTVIYSFLLGGLFCLIAQGLAGFWSFALDGTAMAFFKGGAVLVSLGVIGFILGGLAIYQYFEEWATFGALFPFAGFAMAVGMKMVVPWTKGESLGKSIWPGAWLVIWFNLVGAVVCIIMGYVAAMLGWSVPEWVPSSVIGLSSVSPANEAAIGAMSNADTLQYIGNALTIGARAFVGGGIICAIFQIIWLAVSGAVKNAKHVWILMAGWMCGAIFAIPGVSQFLVNEFGQGFGCLIPVGGYNMFNVGVDFFHGGDHFTEGLVHLGSFGLAVFGLFFTGLGTFVVWNAKFGRKNLHEVHLERARHAYIEAGGELPAETPVSEAVEQKE